MRLLRSLFYSMALGKFLDVQAAFGASGLHAKLVDASLELLRGPAATPAQVRWSGALALLFCLCLVWMRLSAYPMLGRPWLLMHVAERLTGVLFMSLLRPPACCRRSWRRSCACWRPPAWSTSSRPCRA